MVDHVERILMKVKLEKVILLFRNFAVDAEVKIHFKERIKKVKVSLEKHKGDEMVKISNDVND